MAGGVWQEQSQKPHQIRISNRGLGRRTGERLSWACQGNCSTPTGQGLSVDFAERFCSVYLVFRRVGRSNSLRRTSLSARRTGGLIARWRSEEHTSELQSRGHLVCRLLLE